MFINLLIESINTIPLNSCWRSEAVKVQAELNVSIVIHNSETGDILQTIKCKSVADSRSENEAIRGAIENFINGKFESQEPERIRGLRVNHVGINLPEPFYSLFEQLFNAENWSMELNKLQ